MVSVNQKYALISVYDKSQITWFAKELEQLDYSLLATGGTAKLLQAEGLKVTEVSEFTKDPELFGGRVKTLNPKLFGGVLYNRDRQEDCDESQEHNIPAIDLVVVNFYPFKEKACDRNLPLDKAIEFVDIGGPSLLRAAAKNWKHAVPVSSPGDYENLISSLKQGELSSHLRQSFATKAFKEVLDYDQMIADYFSNKTEENFSNKTAAIESEVLEKKLDLRYGENPNQKAALYSSKNSEDLNFQSLHGKALSYNNILDVDSGLSLVHDFKEVPVFAVLKHTNPCGLAWGEGEASDIFRRARACDPLSAFGGIVVTNQEIDEQTAVALNESFLECVIAPSFTESALTLLKMKKNRRLISVDFKELKNRDQMRTTHLGFLKQEAYPELTPIKSWELKAGVALSSSEQKNLLQALCLVKHIKSNGIALVNKQQSIGVACGHVSRVDATVHALKKAQEFNHELEGAYLASDAFFPFRDCVDLAAKHKIKAIIQPGGSVRDEESIQACHEHGISLYFCEQRYFKH